MNRRDFFGAMLAGMTAALSLRFAPFVAWWERWFGKRVEAYADVNRFREALKKLYPKERLQNIAMRPGVIWMNPRDYAQLQEVLAHG